MAEPSNINIQIREAVAWDTEEVILARLSDRASFDSVRITFGFDGLSNVHLVAATGARHFIDND